MVFFKRHNLRSMVVLPMWIGLRQIGVLVLNTEQKYEFGSAEIRLYVSLIQQMAVAIENKQLLEQTQRRAERESIINTISQRIQSTTSIEGALEAATREIGHLLKAKRAVVQLDVEKSTNGKSQ